MIARSSVWNCDSNSTFSVKSFTDHGDCDGDSEVSPMAGGSGRELE